MKRIALLALCLGAGAPLGAQDLTITNAHIVVGNGRVLEHGSIVVRGGRIVSVAEGAPASTSGRSKRERPFVPVEVKCNPSELNHGCPRLYASQSATTRPCQRRAAFRIAALFCA